MTMHDYTAIKKERGTKWYSVRVCRIAKYVPRHLDKWFAVKDYISPNVDADARAYARATAYALRLVDTYSTDVIVNVTETEFGIRFNLTKKGKEVIINRGQYYF